MKFAIEIRSQFHNIFLILKFSLTIIHHFYFIQLLFLIHKFLFKILLSLNNLTYFKMKNF